MRTLTDLYVPPTRAVTLAEPISKNQWFAGHTASQFEHQLKMRRPEISFTLLLMFVVAAVMSGATLPVISAASIAVITITVLLNIYAYPTLAQAIIQHGEKKELAYRRKHAHVLVAALSKEGLSVVCEKSKTVEETLTVDNMPFLHDENNVRYRLNYIQWDGTSREISLFAFLSDPEVEKELMQDSKQGIIDSLVERENTKNGIMSIEKQSGFVKALNQVL